MAYNYAYTRKQVVRRILTNSNGSGSISSSTLQLADRRSGSSVPNYRKKIARGESASSSYTRYVEDFKVIFPPRGNGASLSPLTSSMDGAGYCIPLGLMPTILSSDARKNYVLGDFIQAIDEEFVRVQSLPFLLEFGKTKRMVQNRANSLVSATDVLGRRVKSLYHRYRGVLNGWRRFTKSAGSYYLEWKFGVAPVMSDISSAYSELKYGSKSIMSPAVKVQRSWDAVNGSYANDVAGGISYRRSTSGKSDLIIAYGGRLRPVLIGLDNHWGANVGSIPGVIWEVTPWSWLADYFLNIQAFLTQFQYMNMSLSYGYTSVIIKGNQVTRLTPHYLVTTVYSAVTGVTLKQRADFVRDIFTDLPFYTPTLNLAGPLEGLRGLNIAALLSTKFKRY